MIRVVVVDSPCETLDADGWTVEPSGVLYLRKGDQVVAAFAHGQWSHFVDVEFDRYDSVLRTAGAKIAEPVR